MSSFEWMELQSLTNDIELSRSRLVEARSRGDRGRVRALEQEIVGAEKSRLQLLTHISTNIGSAAQPASRAKGKDGSGSRQAPAAVAEALPDEAIAEQPLPEPVSTAEPASRAKGKDGAGPRQTSAAVAEALPDEGAVQDEANGEQPLPERVDQIVASGATSPASLKTEPVKEGFIMWDQLKSSDIERAKTELGARRAEVLTRHATELRGLDVERSQLETLDQAVDAFLQKINRSAESTVIELRQQSNG